MKQIITATVLLIGVCLVFTPSPSTAETRLREAIAEENYSRAKELVGVLENPAEKLFFEGFLAFKQGEYPSAQSRFEKLVQEHPDSSRAEDASYFLDRIKLYSPKTNPPDVRVQLSAGEELSGSVTGPTVARRASGETLTELGAGQTWSVQRGYLSSTFSTGGESYSIEDGQGIVLTPTESNAHLVHDDNRYRGSLTVKRAGQSFVLVNVLPLDKYLFGVVRKEIAPDWPMETIKAQSVAARSFALSKLDGDTDTFDLKSSHLAQVYGGMDAETKRVRRAVKATRGEVLTHADRVVPAYFHANSGGHIETAHTVWNSTKTPYIVAKPDTWSQNTQHARWDATISLRRINRGLTDENYPEPAGNPGLRVESRLDSGRPRTVSYRTGYNSRNRLSANDLRMAIGPNKLKSTWIETIERSGSTLKISGRGWGHGIGMSQWGAHEMGENGMTYREMLAFYYERAQLMDQYGFGTPGGESDTGE